MARISASNIPDGWPERAARLAVTVTWAGARVVSVALLLIVWELVARSGIVTPFQLPALSRVLERIWSDAVSGDLAINTAVTLYRAMVGFVIAAVGGVALGLAMSRSALARWFIDPIISVGFPMPKSPSCLSSCCGLASSTFPRSP